jgi:hypothetical protein
MKIQDNNYFYISQEKEMYDTEALILKMAEDEWVQRDTIMVNCAPEYSSILTQRLNHGLSFLNRGETFEVIPFQMPYPKMSQVWNPENLQYEKNDYYVKNWLIKYINKDYKYLFISSGLHLFDRLKLSLHDIDYKLCSPYVQEDKLVPDYYVNVFNSQQGRLLYSWQNSNNPNW